MNILFISDYITQSNNGASIISKRNYSLLKKIYKEENIHVFSIMNKLHDINTSIENIDYICPEKGGGKKIINYLQGNLPMIDNKSIDIIMQTVQDNNINLVFLDNSHYGKIAKKIKKKNENIKIITFFHDVKYNFMKDCIRHFGIRKIPMFIVSTLNEIYSVKYSDRVITLNQRESDLLMKVYKVSTSMEIPITIKDTYNENRIKVNNNDKNLTALFVGNANHYPNIHGLKWFVDNVLNHVDVKLNVIGKDMERYSEEFTNDKVNLIGSVPRLDEYYYESDFVIAPIFKGGGMKVKVAEALMYGKFIIGSKEAFEGYDIVEGIHGFSCVTPQQYIDSINKFAQKKSKFKKESRELYVSKYSDASAENLFKELLTDLLTDCNIKCDT